jgi:ATP-dependent Clp endopeptidase proteolytic subunit ClpP
MTIDYFFMYTVDPSAEEPIMLIDGHIGFDEVEGFGVMGDLFQKELLTLDGMGKKRIQVWINSEGGIVQDGYSIYNAILKSKTKVDTYCTGMAASIAAVIFQAGRNRIMNDYAWLMYHNPYGGSDKGLDTITESLATMVANRTGNNVDEIKTMMKKTTFITADEAKESGLCDVVEPSSESNKKRVTAVGSDVKAFWREASTVMNKLIEPQKNLNMKKVANKLNLNAEASEESIVSEIEKVQNKLSEQQLAIAGHLDTIKNKTSDLEKKEADLKAAQEECDKLKAEIKKMKDEAKAKEDAEKAKAAEEETAKAKNMIEGYVKDGRIKNEEKAITQATENCKILGLEKFKNMIDALPLNKQASKITIEKTTDAPKVGSVVNKVMAKKLVKMSGASAE